MNWGKYISVYILAFPVVMIINQSFYNFTFKGYALAAAFPKVCILTGIVAFLIYFLKNSQGSDQRNDIINVTPPQNPPTQIERTRISPLFELKATENSLSRAEMRLIKDHLAFYEALELGTRDPATDAQRHFVDVINGKTAPRTQHERAFLKYISNRNRSR